MKLSELNNLLKSKNIDIRKFNVSYIVPTISFKNKKEVVTEFYLKFEVKQDGKRD